MGDTANGGTSRDGARAALAHALRTEMTERGWRPADLARKANVPTSTLSPILKGRSTPSSPNFNALLDTFFPTTKNGSSRPQDRREAELYKREHEARKALSQLWDRATLRTSAVDTKEPLTPARNRGSTTAHEISGSTGDLASQFIRAVEDFVQQIGGIRPDGFLGSTSSVADTAFAARAWDAVRQTAETIKTVRPAIANHAEAVWETVTRFYRFYLQAVEPEGDENPDSMTYLQMPYEPASPEELKKLGAMAGKELDEPLEAFCERWRELHRLG